MKCYGPRFSTDNEDVRFSRAFQYDSIREALDKYLEFVADCTKFNCGAPDKCRLYHGTCSGHEETDGYPADCDIVINSSGSRCYE